MFVEQLRRAVEAAPRLELTKVSALLWKAYAAGQVSEAEASALSEAIEAEKGSPGHSQARTAAFRLPAKVRGQHGEDGAGGPPPGPCRPRSPAGSPWPSRPSWPWSRPST